MGSVMEEAVKDAKELQETAMETAKNVLLEAMMPKIKEVVDSQLEGTDVQLEMDGISEADEQDEVNEAEEVDESAQLSEEPEQTQEALELADESAMVSGVPGMEGLQMDALDNMGEAGKKKAKKDKAPKGLPGMEMSPDESESEEDEKEDEEDTVDEVVEVTNEDLQAALSEAFKEVKSRLQKEAKVTKSFGEPAQATIKAAGGKGEKGIADEKSGEHYWNDEKPPAAKDWTVKEAKYRKALASLNEQLSEYKEAYGKLLGTLKETNVFNAKLLYTNKVLQNSSLSNKSKLKIIEMFDNAQSRRDVELIYKSLNESFKIAGMVSESSRKLQRASRSTPPVLKEESLRKGLKAGTNSDDEDSEKTMTETWQHLAGLKDVLKD